MGSRKPVVVVNLDRSNGNITAEVYADGKPVQDAEVQWRSRTPWRHAPGGQAQYVEPDPEKCLSAIRFEPVRRLLVTARVSWGSGYAQSESMEIEI